MQYYTVLGPDSKNKWKNAYVTYWFRKNFYDPLQQYGGILRNLQSCWNKLNVIVITVIKHLGVEMDGDDITHMYHTDDFKYI